jgi:hypothetical protein
MKAVRIIGIVIILCSIVPLGIAYYWYSNTRSFLENAVKTEATVVEMEKRKSDDGTMYYPVFSFLDKDGSRQEIPSIISFFLCFAFIGFVLLPTILIAGLVFIIIATLKANKGEPYRYPLTMRFIK